MPQFRNEVSPLPITVLCFEREHAVDRSKGVKVALKNLQRLRRVCSFDCFSQVH